MRNLLFGVAGVLALIALVYYGGFWPFGREELGTPQKAAAAALAPGEAKDQEMATARLVAFGEAARAEMRDVLAKSQNPGVRAQCLQGLAMLWDYESMPAMLAALSDESARVREQAGAAVKHMLSFDVGYGAADPPEKREAAAKRLREQWESWRNSPLFKTWQQRLQGQYQLRADVPSTPAQGARP